MPKKKNTERIVYECPGCKAMVFVKENLHAALCGEYKKNPGMVESTHRIHHEMIAYAQKPKTVNKEKYL